MAEPYPKSRQLGEGRAKSRRWRIRARRETWAELHAAKDGPCRLCHTPTGQLHHIVPRSLGGDDVKDNLIPLCGSGTRGCHGLVELRYPTVLEQLATRLDDAEYAYVISRLGEDGHRRLFGV